MAPFRSSPLLSSPLLSLPPSYLLSPPLPPASLIVLSSYLFVHSCRLSPQVGMQAMAKGGAPTHPHPHPPLHAANFGPAADLLVRQEWAVGRRPHSFALPGGFYLSARSLCLRRPALPPCQHGTVAKHRTPTQSLPLQYFVKY